MKKLATTAMVVAAALAGVAGGFLLGKGGVGERPGDAGEEGGSIGRRAAEEAPAAKTTGAAGTEQADRAASVAEAGDGRIAEYRSLGDILDLPGQANRVRAVAEFTDSLDEEEFREALEALRKAPRGMDTVVMGMMLYGAFVKKDADAAIAYADELPPNERAMARGFIVSEWGATDPAEASAFLMQGVDAEGKLDALSLRMLGGLANEWARSDPRAALQWVIGLDEQSKQGKQGAMHSVITQWAGRDPIDAAGYLRQMPEGEERKRAFEILAGEWARTDSRAALNWAQGLPDWERPGAVAKAVVNWAQEDAAAAAAYVSELEDEETQALAMNGVAVRWSWKAPREAVDWLATQPESEGRRKATREVMGAWARKDAHAASAWLAEQEPGPTTDGAIEAFTERVMYDDPGSAAVWASAIDDSQTRLRQMVKAGRQWLRHEAEAAEEWIQASDMPENFKEELLSR